MVRTPFWRPPLGPLLVGLAALAPAAHAAEAEDAQTLQQMQQEMQQLQQRLQDQERRLQALSRRAQNPSAAGNASGLQVGLSGLFAFGGSSVDNAGLAELEAGGHDPNQNGFTVQNVELSLGAAVDPYFDARANIVYQIDADGETVVELEEAYFITRSLPAGLQVKGGQYFTEFGRLNNRHPHTWAFADQPVILTRLFGGDGLRGPGARVAWLMPLDWFSELTFGAQNARGETQTSFLYAPGEAVAGHTLLDRQVRDLGDLLYTARWLNGTDLSDNLGLNLGLSGAWGPNASGTRSDTAIGGADLYLKWQPDYVQRGFPFVAWHTEVLKRRYQAGDPGAVGSELLRDWGLFSQALWGFRPGWVAGLRWEYASADGGEQSDPLRDTRRRLSTNLTWYPTEFSKLRLQYNRDQAGHLAASHADSLWLQVEFNIGSHMAHRF